MAAPAAGSPSRSTSAVRSPPGDRSNTSPDEPDSPLDHSGAPEPVSRLRHDRRRESTRLPTDGPWAPLGMGKSVSVRSLGVALDTGRQRSDHPVACSKARKNRSTESSRTEPTPSRGGGPRNTRSGGRRRSVTESLELSYVGPSRHVQPTELVRSKPSARPSRQPTIFRIRLFFARRCILTSVGLWHFRKRAAPGRCDRKNRACRPPGIWRVSPGRLVEHGGSAWMVAWGLVGPA